MVGSFRRQYNETFTNEKYIEYIKDLKNIFPGQLDFRVAETPLFIPAEFTNKMISACEAIIDVVTSDEYRKQSDDAIPKQQWVPGENAYPHCIAFDFGICSGSDGKLEPQLIEMQGFPSLFCWQVFLPEIHHDHFQWPEDYSPYLNGHTKTSYVELLREVIIGKEDPANVILLEILPHLQKTRVDFFATEALLGINTVCLTSVIQEGNKLYYDLEGKKTRINRIYNRVIFDDLEQQSPEVREKGKIFQQQIEVEWIPHPNWFFRISKFSLPFINHPYVPETMFLPDFKGALEDLENWVVKPLFSFAGQGVIIDVTKEDIENIREPQNWIIQKKVKYASAILTPGEMAKAEIRIFYFWPPGAKRPVAANNLCRLSKGKMVGVRYNKDKDWVGGSFCLFEQ